MSRLALGFVLLAACGSNGGSNPPGDDDDDDTGGVDAGEDPGESSAPLPGPWGYNDTVGSNSCPAGTPTGELGAFAIDQVSAAGFRVSPNDGSASFTCDLARDGFDCPDRGALTQDLRPAIDAVLTVQAVASGAFSNPKAGSGEQSATVSCAGTQCAALGAFPCTIVLDFTIEALF